MKRYEELANTIATEIAAGRIKAGTRLPSVRTLTTQYGIGQTTVFRAYYLLEERGLIQVRERSGYYVAQGVVANVQQNPARDESPAPALVSVSDVIFSVLDAVRHPGIVPLGSAFPSPMLFPLYRLSRAMSQAGRTLGPWNSVLDMPPGNEHLRRQIALRYTTMGAPQTLDEILITNGALEALNLCLLAVTKPGDIVAIESPCFYAALQAVERFGLRAVEIPVDPVTGLDLGVLESALRAHPVRAVWAMTNFQNPTGASLSREKKRALVALLAKYQCPLIEDDVYGELYFGPERPPPAKAFDTEGLVMHCTSLSKVLAPGYRLGWVAAGRFADAVRRQKLMTSISTSGPIQAGLAEYLQHGGFEKHLRKLRTTLNHQMETMEEAIQAALPRSIRYHRPAGGYFLWLRLPAEVDAMQLHASALTHGINVTPGTIFSRGNLYGNYIRLNCGHPWTPKMADAIKTLGELLDTLLSRDDHAALPSPSQPLLPVDDATRPNIS
ncbi:PLP-dependent aminotransferase family protein [Paraburkholderia sp. J12]|uniref:aminotransferase-like domain-containing protein n=1 Tax=Paraburkholderia sp. J12 TaxID=2805432 RepID=UPI002ABE8960|nr:PLP-dependent aminotransferase family protein [Paraburkholderia sp. J12]